MWAWKSFSPCPSNGSWFEGQEIGIYRGLNDENDIFEEMPKNCLGKKNYYEAVVLNFGIKN